MPQNVMPQIMGMAGIPGYSIVVSHITISPKPEDGEVFKVDTKTGDGQELLCLRKPGIQKFIVAGNIAVQEETVSRVGDQWRWQASWRGTYVLPSGEPLPMEGNKEIDFTIGGTRWSEMVSSETERLLHARGKAAKIAWKSGMSYTDYATIAAKLLPEEVVDEVRELATARATRRCTRAAQFGLEMAETGARLRGVGAHMNLKSAYTAQELTDGFLVPCVSVDPERMRAVLGEDRANEIFSGLLLARLGVSADFVTKLLSSTAQPVPVLAEMPAEELLTAEMEEMPGNCLDGLPGETTRDDHEVDTCPFSTPVEDSLLAELARLAAETEFASLGGAVGYVLHKQDISHGDGLVMHWFFENILTAVAAGRPISEAKAKAAATARQAVAERRLPQEQE